MLEDKTQAIKGAIVIGKESKQVSEITDRDRERWARRSRWGWVEATIWTDSMLAALENGVKGNKWFSLIDKAHKPTTLLGAWERVRASRGAAGVDKVTIQKFESQEFKYLKELEQELKDGTYRPKAVKRVYIPKERGKMRPLGIPCVKDRIAQQAVKMAIEPIFEREFLDISYGFRPRRGAMEAIDRVNKFLEEGYTWYVDADLQAYFDTIPHDILLNKIKQRISDGRILNLLELWLKQEIMEECNEWKPFQGTPQGGVISPLLANIYLHDQDVFITNLGFKMIRYADDFVILTKTREEAEKALQWVKEWILQNGLTLHPEKTHVGNCMVEGDGFDFLGYRFEAGKTWVRKKSIQRFRERVRKETSRQCGKAITDVINKLNPMLRGWANYFKGVTKYSLDSFDSFVRRRLRAIIEKQNKRKSFGSGSCNLRIPNKYFAKIGLFSMEAFQAQYRACQSR